MSIERMKEKILAIQARVPMVRGRGEEATKQALVLPMLEALGYDIWNPTEVCPEFEADFAVKKQGQKEKVDLGIALGGEPRIFIEVKAVDEGLDGHQGQLARYFNGVTTVSLGVLTNGVEYRFFTDTGEPNILDSTPFYVFRLDAPDLLTDTLTRFHKSVFAPGAIRDFATELHYTNKMTAFLRAEIDLGNREPSDSLLRWMLAADGMYEGRVVASVLERFRPIAKNALQVVLREVVRRSLAAMDGGVVAGPRTDVAQESNAVGGAQPPSTAAGSSESGAEAPARSPTTTEAELGAFAVVREQFQTSALRDARIYDAGARREVPIDLSYKDTTVYFGMYFNKPGWWFARLQLDGKQPWLAVNLPAEGAAALLPPGFSLLPGNAFGDVRVAIRSADDLHALNRIIFAAMQRTVEERKPRLESPESPSRG